MEYHTIGGAEALSLLKTDPASGLSDAEAASRLQTHGPNELTDRGGKSPWIILREQFTSTMALILECAALLSWFVGSMKDCVTILAIVVLFATLGFVQEYRAERAMRALKRLAVPVVRVRRNGIIAELAAGELVPGDMVILEAGNLIPADCRIVEAHNLRVQESVLTGEAEAVDKLTDSLTGDSMPLGDRKNMLYMGTTVTFGRGAALVTATGMRTELGKIADLLQGVTEEWTPLQKRLDKLGKTLAAIAVAVSGLYFGIGMLRGEELKLLLMTSVSLAVAAIPEGLPAVVTITLALGAQRMLKRRALIRKLPAVEALGSVTVICSDKTGTLTENRMTVTETVTAASFSGSGKDGDQALLAAAALCNDAHLKETENGVEMVGDPTETALLMAARNIGFLRYDLEKVLPRIAEIPFDAATRKMLTLHRTDTGANPFNALGMGHRQRLIVVKGGVDGLLHLCSTLADGTASVLDEESNAAILAAAEKLAANGRRVLAVAVAEGDEGTVIDQTRYPEGLAFLGLIAMMDPPRDEARQAVSRCRDAGIRPVMITGDHPLTAMAIATSLGIPHAGQALTGAELEALGVGDLERTCPEISLYARVSPEHKLLIVEALRKRGEVVAMTGDGVNDAPALKRADIGVAMGITGTDVAKEASDMVLLDDNFATIVAAVEEGRTIYDNIRKFIEFSVAGNLGKIMAVLCLPLLGLAAPLTPLQLLWLNLLTDGLLGLGMGMERPEPNVMRRPPISPDARIFDRAMIRHVILTGLVIGCSVIILTLYARQNRTESWQTMLFTSLAFAQIGQAMALRSSTHSFFSIGLFTNPLLLAMAACVIILQGSVINLPLLRPFFTVVPLSGIELLWTLLPGATVFVVLEVEKIFSAPSQQPASFD